MLRSDFADFLPQLFDSPILRVGYLPRPVETSVGLHWPVEIFGYSGQRLVDGRVVVGQLVGLRFYW